MALKDWKKVGKDDWSNKKGSDNFFIRIKDLSIIKQEGYVVGYGRKASFGRLFSDSKTFKTKSAALKFAKSYMREH